MSFLKSLGNWRQITLRAMGWFHIGWVYALYYAGIYQVVLGDQELPWRLWWGLLSVIPLALADLGTEVFRRLWQYLLWSLAVCGLAWLLLGTPLDAVPLALVCFFRGKNQLSEEPVESVLDRPSIPIVLAAVPPFFYSAIGDAPLLQKLSLIWAALYLLLWAAWRGLANIHGYLSLNRDMAGVPVKRIVRTTGVAVLAMVLLAGGLLLPALAMGTGYLRINPNPQPGQRQVQVETTSSDFMAMPDWMQQLGENDGGFQMPAFVSYFFMALAGALVVVCLLYGVYWVIRGLRGSFVDHRDVVQNLRRDPEDQVEETFGKRTRRPRIWDRSPSAQVRRRYRRAVLRAAKEEPPRWAAPQEIEREAGLEDPLLHQLYEKARYSQEGCTAQESRSLKR